MRIGLVMFIAVCLMGLGGCSGSSDDAPKAIATSGPATGDLMVHGTITKHGKPLAGVKVWFQLWPVNDGNIEEGEAIDMWDSTPVTTDGDGRYALRLDPDELTSMYFGGDFLNFDLNMYTDGKGAMWASTVNLIQHKVWRTYEQSLVGDPVLTMSADLGISKITLVDSMGDRETGDLPLMAMPSGFVPRAH